MSVVRGIYTKPTAERVLRSVDRLDLSGDQKPLALPDLETQVWFVKAVETIEPAEDPDLLESPLTAWKTGKVRILSYVDPGTGYNRQEAGTDDEDLTVQVTVVNRDPNWFIAKGDTFWIANYGVEFVPLTPRRTTLEAVLIEDLTPSSSSLTTPKTAKCRILHPSSTNKNQLVMTAWHETVVSRFEELEDLDAGTYVHITRLNGVWHITAADCGKGSIDLNGTQDSEILGTKA